MISSRASESVEMTRAIVSGEDFTASSERGLSLGSNERIAVLSEGNVNVISGSKVVL